jgi:hypothetical protein
LVPHCASPQDDDRGALTDLANLLTKEVKVVNLTDIPPDPLAADLIRNASVSIGSRFHNAVLSASAGRPAILFPETEYDEQRALGLAALPGNAVSVMPVSEEGVAQRTRQALSRPTVPPRYREPRPIVSAMHRLGIVGGVSPAGPPGLDPGTDGP